MSTSSNLIGRIKMFIKRHFNFMFRLLTTLLAIALLLSACTPAAETLDPTATSAPAATTAPEATAVPDTPDSLNITLDTGSMAAGFATATIAAVPAGDVPYWEVLPEHTRLTLQGYPISDHLMMPQIFIYPVKELGEANEGAGQIVTTLQTLLGSPQEITPMPFMPLFNASQVMHAHVQYVDFKNGQGLRYLTEFDQGIVPINNHELIYTYQGLTSDGKYYVAAVLPVNHPSLPADESIMGNEPPEFTSDFPAYLANVAGGLNPQSADTFTPDLTQLDAMMSSLEIN